MFILIVLLLTIFLIKRSYDSIMSIGKEPVNKLIITKKYMGKIKTIHQKHGGFMNGRDCWYYITDKGYNFHEYNPTHNIGDKIYIRHKERVPIKK